MTDRPQSNQPRTFFSRGLHWPVLVTLLFLGNIALAVTVIVISTGDPSFAVEPDYYDKALNWNDEIEQRTQNQRLGWSVRLAERPTILAGADHTDLTLVILDQDAEPIDNASMEIIALPVARADRAQSITGRTIGAGRYTARLTNPIPGKWQIRVRVAHNDHTFTHTLTTSLSPGP